MSDNSSSEDTGAEPDGSARRSDFFVIRLDGSQEEIARVLNSFELDIGCRHADVRPNDDGLFRLTAFATEERIREVQAAGYWAVQGENVSARGRALWREDGKGDRFEAGRLAPRGYGRKGDRKGEGDES